jgi:CO/xanthine dehydrogenase Mo-binding subunit
MPKIDDPMHRVEALLAVVQDCGQVINPDGTKNQIEGNVVQTVSRTLLIEQVRLVMVIDVAGELG